MRTKWTRIEPGIYLGPYSETYYERPKIKGRRTYRSLGTDKLEGKAGARAIFALRRAQELMANEGAGVSPYARYTFSVCPFMVGRKNHALEIPPYENVTVDPNVSTERPKKLGFLFARTYEMTTYNQQIYYRPVGLRGIEWREMEHV